MESSIPVNTLQNKKAIFILRILDNRQCCKILQLLHRKGKTRVKEIYKELHREQSETSQKLAKLRKAGFVHTERQGKEVHYSINYTRLETVQASVHQLLQ